MGSNTVCMWVDTRPKLVVELKGGGKLGNCYSSTVYTVTSRRPMSTQRLLSLQASGCMDSGQEFICHLLKSDGTRLPVPNTIDWRSEKDIEPTGCDEIECSEVDVRTGKIVRTPSINPYNGLPDQPSVRGYWVYQVEVRIDSSD